MGSGLPVLSRKWVCTCTYFYLCINPPTPRQESVSQLHALFPQELLVRWSPQVVGSKPPRAEKVERQQLGGS